MHFSIEYLYVMTFIHTVFVMSWSSLGGSSRIRFLSDQPDEQERVFEFTNRMRESMHKCMVAGQGTRDLCGPEGLTTEGFIDVVASTMMGNPVPEKLTRSKTDSKGVMHPSLNTERGEVDFEAIKNMFSQ